MKEQASPHNLDAEMYLLGTLLSGEERAWNEIYGYLTADDFYKPAHRKIFSVIIRLEETSEPIDVLTVSNCLEKSNDLETIGGSTYLAELISFSPSGISIQSCARIIKEKSLLRSVIKTSNNFIKQAQGQEFENVDMFLDSLEADIFKISQKETNQNLVPINQLVSAGMDQIENAHKNKLDITGLSTSFEELDNITSGFQPGELIIIASRPSMGKTALSLNIALRSALTGKKVAFFSVEMVKEQLILRLLSSLTRIRLSSLKVGNIPQQDWDILMQGAGKLSETQFFIDDSTYVSPFDIRSRLRRLKAKHGLDLVIVDYIQLMSMKKSMDSREREVSEISRLLKSISKELSIPVIALSQLNRGVESRTNRRPLLSDLRESGSIEQDADVIIMLYRDEYYNPNSTQKGKIELIINKQRNGPTGTVHLRWLPEYNLFENNIVSDLSPMPDHPM